PGFTTAAVLTLALGIGANTAFFSVVDALAFQSAPSAHLTDVFVVQGSDSRGRTDMELPVATLRTLESQPLDKVVSVAAKLDLSATIQSATRAIAETVRVEAINAGFAAALDLSTQAGRWISPDEDRANAPVVVISDRLWRERFDRDR